MREVTLDSAIDMAERYLNEVIRNPYDSLENDRWVISTDNIKDRGTHWLFHYQSKLYLTTGKPSYLLIGNLPLKVSKSTGEILGFEE